MEYEEHILAEVTAANKTRKKPYAPPRLTSHGDAHEITRALDIGGTDGQSGSQLADGAG